VKTKLTDKQLELITKVRDRMQADFEAEKHHERCFICHNIVLIENGLEVFCRLHRFDVLVEKDGSMSKDLVEMIDEAIDLSVTFESYLSYLDIGLIWSDICLSFAQLGRLAWLDKIVATGEIA
jgi:hypothetical protein